MQEAQSNYVHPHAALAELLVDMFTGEELRRFARFLPDGEELSYSLPGPGVAHAELCHAFVDLLGRRGMVDAAFFERLREERPARAAEIGEVAIVWNVAMSAQEPIGTGASLEVVEADDNGQPIRSARLRFAVEASEAERALDVDDYATALATVLDRSDGGVFFAVFGPWGRGKTFLMRRLAKLLPEFTWLSKRYEVVWFSAWRYPTTPEVWVHLYETLAAHAYSGSWARMTRRVVRGNIQRHGIMPGLVAVLVGAAAMLPITFYLDLVWYLLATLGLFGLLAVVRVSRAVASPARRLRRQYMTPVSHAEKLGLQAVIGEDLRALVDGWLHDPANSGTSRKQAAASLAVIAVVAAALWIGLASVGVAYGWVPPLVSVLWLVLASGAALWLAQPPRSIDRVLLVVDDLDRCKPDHVCDVIESLKLMAEAPELAGRIQVAALVEEEALDWAIARRFGDRSGTAAVGKARTPRNLRDRLVQEHKQKLFLGHLHLPELSERELSTLLRTYLCEGKDAARLVPALEVADAPVVAADAVSAAANTSPMTEPNLPRPRRGAFDIARQSHDGDLFEAHEREALLQIVPLLHREHLGPRSLRSFLFRYQLARLLLAIRGASDISPARLARGLLQANADAARDDDLRAVLNMVR